MIKFLITVMTIINIMDLNKLPEGFVYVSDISPTSYKI